MTAYFILRTPSGPVRFSVNEEAREDEPVLVREEEMDAGLLLFALVDAQLEYRSGRSRELFFEGAIPAELMVVSFECLGQWRALWWGTR